MVGILMMPAKLVTVGLLKMKKFWYNGCDAIVSVHDPAITILSCDSNHIVNVVMRPKFGNSGITMREITITLVL